MDERDIDRVAEVAAQKTLKNLFMTLGINIDDPTEVQRDMAFLRNWRQSTEAIKRQGMVATFIVVLTGVLGLIWATVVNK